MGKLGQKESDSKSNLVTEICGISSLSNACVHIKQRHSPGSLSPFIDWYRLLGVEEQAGIDVIRKRYHKLALQLHPDKNKHPKADIAFKLVSEAHACLTDNSKRSAFDSERWKNVCFKCTIVHSSSPKSSPKHNKPRSAPLSRSKSSHRFIKSLRDIRDRFREETKVIERCLRSNRSRASTRRDSPDSGPPDCLLRTSSVRTGYGESPIFDPSDYEAFEGYPHIRSRIQGKPESFWYLQAGRVLNFDYRGIGAKCDSPIFEVRSSNTGVFKSRSACVHS